MTLFQARLERLAGRVLLSDPGGSFQQMKELCAHFDHPEKCCPVFHVAGSKGKGSTAAYIASILDQAGYKVGRLASPYVAHFTERFECGNEDFSDEEYLSALEELEKGLAKLQISSLPHSILMTLYGFLLFRKAGCDFSVVEVGLGGRFDPTNVVTPEVSVITSIELEHTKMLGGTLREIAAHKAGIIKPNVPVVVAEQEPKVTEVIFEEAKKCKAEIVVVGYEKRNFGYFFSDSFDEFTGKPVLRAEVKDSDEGDLTLDLKMLGEFQIENALLAITAIRTFSKNEKHFEISRETIERGISAVQLPARFDVRRNVLGYDGIPYLIIDGAHTAKSVAGAVEVFLELRKLESVKNAQDSCLTDFVPGAEPLLLFSTGEDKQAGKMAKELKKAFDVVIFTTLKQKKVDPEKLKGAFREAGFGVGEDSVQSGGEGSIQRGEVRFIENPKDAVKIALKIANCEKRPLMVIGSLYLAGEVYQILEEKAEVFSKIFASQ